MHKTDLFIIAGEPSGDLIGGKLLLALKEYHPNLKIAGIGGETMTSAGLISLFPINDLAVMGFTEVIPKLYKIYTRIQQTVEKIKILNPKVLLTIDSPSFCLRVAAQTKVKKIHYVAPSVWAWRPGRAKKLAKTVDHLLTLFPCEPQYFTPHGLNTTFVGHPVIEYSITKQSDFLTKFDLTKNQPIILILPGSRTQEIINHLPIFLKAYQNTNMQGQLVIPLLPHHQLMTEKILQDCNLTAKIITTQQDKWQAFLHADAAIAASGTVTLELAKAGVPMVVAYKTSPLTFAIAKKLVKIPYICLVNIILQQNIVPECIQQHCSPNTIANNLKEILNNPQRQKEKFQHLMAQLTPPDNLSPSFFAASTIIPYIK